MAVAFDAGASLQNGSSGTSTVVNLTVGAGSNRALLVGIVADVDFSITSLNWNGDAITTVEQGLNTSLRSVIYSLVAPDSGANSLTVNHESGRPTVHVAAFTGVDQTTPVNHTGGAIDDGASPQGAAITVDAGGMAFSLFGAITNATDQAPNGSATAVAAGTNVTGTAAARASYLADATTMGWTWTTQGGSDLFEINNVALKPAGAGGGVFGTYYNRFVSGQGGMGTPSS